jgi:dolichol kinase
MSELRLFRDRAAGYVYGVSELAAPSLEDVKNEIIRKAIHFLAALCPSMAALNFHGTEAFLLCGCLFYTWFEILRMRGTTVPLVSALTRMASRPHDSGRFVLGPITLGLGTFLALTFFPPKIAAVAVYAMAFGDGFAGLVGRIYGRTRPGFLRGKSLEGSFACFAAVFIAAYAVSGDNHIAAIAAAGAMVVEAFPLGDYDNIILPAAVGIILMHL